MARQGRGSESNGSKAASTRKKGKRGAPQTFASKLFGILQGGTPIVGWSVEGEQCLLRSRRFPSARHAPPWGTTPRCNHGTAPHAMVCPRRATLRRFLFPHGLGHKRQMLWEWHLFFCRKSRSFASAVVFFSYFFTPPMCVVYTFRIMYFCWGIMTPAPSLPPSLPPSPTTHRLVLDSDR